MLMRTFFTGALIILCTLLGRAAVAYGPGGVSVGDAMPDSVSACSPDMVQAAVTGGDVMSRVVRRVSTKANDVETELVDRIVSDKFVYAIFRFNKEYVATLLGWYDSYDYYPKFTVPDYVTYEGKNVPVTTVNGSAFIYGWGLESVKFGPNMICIAEYAFYQCGLTDLYIPKNMRLIMNNAFQFCPLENVKFQNPYASKPKLFIGPFAFFCLKIKNFELPARVSSNSFVVKRSFLGNNPALTSISIAPENSTLSRSDVSGDTGDEEEGEEYGAFEMIGDALCVVSGTGADRLVEVVAYPTGKDTKTFEMTENRVGVLGGVLSNCTFETVRLKATAEASQQGDKIAVYNGALEDCTSLTRLELIAEGEALLEPGMDAGCSGLENYEIGDGISNYTVADDVVYTTENGVKVLSNYPCGKTDISFIVPDDVVSICGSAFARNRHLAEVKLPSGLKSIGDEAFYQCNDLNFAELPEHLEHIGNNAFSDTHINEVTIPASLKTLDSGAFLTIGTLNVKVNLAEPPVGSDGNVAEAIFNSATLENGKLVIPAGVKPEVFTSHPAWAFTNVENVGGAAIDETAAEASGLVVIGMSVSASDGSIIELLRPDGVKVAYGTTVTAPAPGIYLVRGDSGAIKLILGM